MTDAQIGLAAIFLVFVLIASRMPVAYVMLVVGVVGVALTTSVSAAKSIAASTVYSTFASYSLITIPLFVWMGFIAFHAGISSRIYQAVHNLMGRMPAGLALATVGASTAFGAICGSTTATAATMSTISVPEMRKHKYNDSLATSVVSASAILGIMIPPSVILILYGIATEQSIQYLFLAGILPGILLAGMFMLVTLLRVLYNPSLAPPGPQVTYRRKALSLLTGGTEIIIVFLLVMGGLFFGYFTPTEAGAAGVGATLLVSLIRRQLTWKSFWDSLSDSVRVSVMIMFLVMSATIFGRFLALTNLPTMLASFTVGLPLPPVAVMAIILLIYLVLGLFIDALALLLLTVPIFYPVAVQLGFDPIWFGVIIVLVVGMGAITPPVGANIYVVAGTVRDVSVITIFRGIWPYVLAILLCAAILVAFPQIVLFLPQLLGY